MFPSLPAALVLIEGGHLDVCDLPRVDETKSMERWIKEERARPGSWLSRDALEDELRSRMRRVTPTLLAAHAAGARPVGSILVGASPEARGAAMSGLLDRVSDGWSRLAAARIPTLLLLATEPPYVHQNRAHLSAFQAAVPHADVRWVAGAGHDIVADVGPEIGDEIAAWILEHA